MKIIIAWDRVTAGVTARHLFHVQMGYFAGVLKERGFEGFEKGLIPSEEVLSQQYLEFEAESFQQGRMQAEVLRHCVDMSVYPHMRARIGIQVVPGRQFQWLEDFAATQEELANKRLTAMRSAIASLKAMRSWFKDKRVGDIRRGLEQNLY